MPLVDNIESRAKDGRITNAHFDCVTSSIIKHLHAAHLVAVEISYITSLVHPAKSFNLKLSLSLLKQLPVKDSKDILVNLYDGKGSLYQTTVILIQ